MFRVFYVEAHTESNVSAITPPTAIGIFMNAAVLPSL